jgi:hypothetical protein
MEAQLTQPISKSSLSDPERRLIELLQDINFGRIENLQVRRGVPAFNPAPDVVRTHKMGSTKGPREEAGLKDFWLKEPVVDLLRTMREIGDGEILSMTVMHGLPHLVEVRHRVHP